MLGWLLGALPPIALRTRLKWILMAAGAVVAAVAVAVLVSPGLRERVMATWSNGLGERGPVFAFGLHLYTSHWIDGAGPGLFGSYYQSAVKAGWKWMGKPLPPIGMPWVHSLPIEVLCEIGTIGALAMLATLAEAVRRLFRAWRSALTDRTTLIAIITAAGCMVTVGLVDLSFIKDWVRVCFWMILGLCFAMAPRERKRAEDADAGPTVG
jgi:O-antigen ligase